MTRRLDWTAYFYILPALLFVGVFIFWGIGYNVFVSMYEWDGISEHRNFVGLQNYSKLLSDTNFLIAMLNTLIFSLIYVAAAVFLGFFMAYLVSFNLQGSGFFKSVIFFPHIMPVAIVAMLFAGFYDMNIGMLNEILRMVGIGSWAQAWIGDPDIVLYAIVGAFIFSQLGFSFMIYYTSMLSINREVLEAADMDGVNFWGLCAKIVFPMMRGVTMSVTIMSIIASLKVFDMVWVMTEGGPGGASELASTFVFRESMINFRQGYASSASTMLLLLALIITVFQLKLYAREGR